MKWFKLNTESTSYTFPIVKIVICLIILLLCFFRYQIVNISNKLLSTVVGILCFQLTVVCILCIYISVADLFQTYLNRKENVAVVDISRSKQLSVDEIINLVCENDIIEFKITVEGKMFKIGASADCKNSSNTFFDKVYYINSTEYSSVPLFTRALSSYASNNYICVLEIDGLHLE